MYKRQVFLGSQPVNGLGIVAWRRMAERAAEELKNFRDHPIPPLYETSDGKGYDHIAHGLSLIHI